MSTHKDIKRPGRPPLPGPNGWAVLEAYVGRKLRTARRQWDSHSRPTGPTGRELCSYWEGQYVALTKLNKKMKACKPNTEVSDGGPLASKSKPNANPPFAGPTRYG